MAQHDDASLSLLDDLVTRARKAGADAADASLNDSVSLSATMRLGIVEKATRAESSEIDLRAFIGKRQAVVSSHDRSPKALAELVERAIAMARIVPEDPFAGQAEASEIARTFPELDLVDPTEPATEKLVDLARRAEDAARAIPKITNSEGADAGWSRTTTALVASNGFAHTVHSTFSQIGVAVVAGEGSGMERDHDWSSARHMADLREAEEVGAGAGRRAVHRLASRKAPTGQVPVVYDPRIASGILGHMSGAINGASIARGTSFLKDALGKKIMPVNITVTDDPFRVRGLRSHPHDGEGVAGKRRAIVENGTLTTWILDLRASRQLGMKTTGHGGRNGGAGPSNMWFEPGAVTAAELISDIARGLYVTELMGMGVNGITGDYSRGAAGFWIENGEIAWPVSEATVAGNLKSMFLNMTLANDLVFRTGIDSPTLRIDGMTVAGA